MVEIQKFEPVNSILEFAVAREQESYQFYTNLATRAERPWMQDVFEQFAQEERGHEAKLQRVQESKHLLPSQGKVLDLKLADYPVVGAASGDINYQQALIIAMNKEKAAFRLYTDLADRVADDSLRTLFLDLAQEEAKHKLRFEVEYDDVILTDN